MRIGVVGAGALGGLFAALLDRAGHEVTVTARGARLEAVAAHGLRLAGAYGDHVARVRALPALQEAPDLALLTVKAQDARTAASRNAPALDGVPLVVVQNGLAGPQALRDLLPATPLIGAASMIAASFLADELVTVTAAAPTVLATDTASPARLADAARVLGAVVDVRLADDLVGLQWSKLVVNQLNAAPAVTGLPMQEALRSPPLVAAIAAAMRETVLVADAAGVALRGLPTLPAALVTALRSGGSAVALLQEAAVDRMGAVPNPGSTLQSLRRGRPTEIDFLSGAVVAEGGRLEVPTPVNTRIVELVRAIAAGAPFLSPVGAADRLTS